MNAATPNSGAAVINAVSKPGRLAIANSSSSNNNNSSSNRRRRNNNNPVDSEDDYLDDDDDEEEEEDEFFDCRENLDDTSSLAKWSSMELTPQVSRGILENWKGC